MLTAQTLKPFGFYLAEARPKMRGHGIGMIATDEALARTDATFHYRKDKHRAEILAHR